MSKYYSITMCIVTFIALSLFLSTPLPTEKMDTVHIFSHIRAEAAGESPQTAKAITTALGEPKGVASPEKWAEYLAGLQNYLEGLNQGHHNEIVKLLEALSNLERFTDVIWEIGCGNAALAWDIASKNPTNLVIAIDIYEPHSAYTSIVDQWERGQLKAQLQPLPNLVVIRAKSDILQYMPDGSINDILLVNYHFPFFEELLNNLINSPMLKAKIRQDGRVVIKPHSEDWRTYPYKWELELGIEFSPLGTKIYGVDFLEEEDENLWSVVGQRYVYAWPINASGEPHNAQSTGAASQSVAQGAGKLNISQAQEIGFIEALQRAKQINTKRAAVIIGDIASVAIPTKTIEIYTYTTERENEAIKKKSDLETKGYVVLLINTTNNTSQLTSLPAVTITSDVQQALNTFLERDV